MSSDQRARNLTPPGPKGVPLLGNALDIGRDILQTLMNGWRGYGDVVYLRGAFPVYFLAHPDAVKLVLQDHCANYQLPPVIARKLNSVVGEALLVMYGDAWLRTRRLAQPAFHRRRIAAFGALMSQAARELTDRWRADADSGRPIEVRSEMARLTLGVLVKALFSADATGDTEALAEAMTVIDSFTGSRVVSVIELPLWLPLPRNRRFRKARSTFDTVVYRLISERRRSAVGADDLLSILIEARDVETGEQMSDQEVHDQLMGFFIAGHEPIAACLAWTFYLLSTHPDAESRLRAELGRVLGGRTPTVDDLPHLDYTRRVIQEAMRLYPPFFMIPRTALKEDEIGGYRIPAGAFVLLSPYVTHRHPSFWKDAEAFDPDRFAPERSEGRPRYAYFPFGGGQKQCIGDTFAMTEMQLIVATVTQAYRLRLVQGHPIALQPKVVLRPRHGVLMTLERQALQGT